MAEWWAVDLLEDDGSLRRIISEGPARPAGPLKGRYPPWPDAPSGPFRVIQTRRPLFVAAPTTLVELAISPDPAHLEALRQMGPAFAICVPMIFRARVVGTMSFTRASDPFFPLNVAFCRTLASRAGHTVMLGRMYQDLQDASRRKDEFLAMLGHELRNPLGAISNAVAVLQSSQLPREAEPPVRAIIGRQLQHLTKIVDDLLDVARLTSGKIALHPIPVDLRVIVERCLTTIRGAGKGGNHDIRVEGRSITVVGDPARLEQVLDNLVDNAVKYTPSGGRITIGLETQGGHATVRVRDTGVGVADELLPRMFDLFAQGAQSLDRRAGGLGVGLAIVKAIVTLHGGTVYAASAGPGTGTEVVVRLPIAPVDSGDHPAEEPSAGPVLRQHILVVEDNGDARESMRLLLELSGHKVELAEDGPRGLDLALRTQPDVALIDLGLPGFDGYDLARRLRAAPTGIGIRLIALTGYSQPEDRRRAREAGFESFLVKPVNRRALDEALAAGVPPAA
jgi:signal transduction histidine kinase